MLKMRLYFETLLSPSYLMPAMIPATHRTQSKTEKHEGMRTKYSATAQNLRHSNEGVDESFTLKEPEIDLRETSEVGVSQSSSRQI